MAKDVFTSMAAAHCIASYVVMIAWVVLVRPREDRLTWTIFVIGAPAAVPFIAMLVCIHGIARGDEKAFGGFAITYAVVLIVATIVIYRRRRSRQPSDAERVTSTSVA